MAYQRIIQARVIGALHGQQTVNVYHFGSNETAADNAALINLLLALATAILQCVMDFLIGAVTSDWRVDRVTVQQLYPAITDPVEMVAPANTVGALSPVSASYIAAVMSFKTGGGGRRGRGRIFLPPPGEAEITTSVITDNVANNKYSQFMLCLSQKFLLPSGTDPKRLVVLSRKTLSLGGTMPDACRDVTNISLNVAVGVMRSRKVGRGG